MRTRSAIAAMTTLVVAAVSTGVGPVAEAKGKPARRVAVTFSVKPEPATPGPPVCDPDGCLVLMPPARSTFTGGLTGAGNATQTVALRPVTNDPAVVSVVAIVRGSVAGCRAGSFVFQGTLNYPTMGSTGSGSWAIVPGSGSGGFEGSTGSGTFTERRVGATSIIDHTGTITCHP